MNFLEVIKDKVQSHLDKRKEEQEMMDRLRLEASLQKKQIFEEEFKKNALEVAKREAKKSAAEMSGLKKLQAINRARRLTETGQSPGSFFEKFSEYTQKNIAKRQENLKRTAELREQAQKMKEKKVNSPPGIERRKPFSPTGFKHG